ncbi:MAG: UDP-glucose dehydrogenase family protein [Janthinobacterium lividum]
MRILVIGTGYVGLTTGIGLGAIGHEVICMDNNLEKINQLNSGIIPIFEPGLYELIKKHKQNIKFTTDIENYINNVDVIIVAVGTPQNSDGSVNIKFITDVFDKILMSLNKDIWVVIKSTVPVNTNKNLSLAAKEKSKYKINIISNPEFLREGYAIHDFFNPDRIIIGSNNDASEIIKKLYIKFIQDNISIIYTDPQTAELTKYASNAFLANKVAFINEMANLCEYYGGDVDQIANIMGLDRRIGKEFLKVGPGFGGSCFPKDLLGLKHFFDSASISNIIIDSVIESNKNRITSMAKRIDNIVNRFNAPIAIFGVSFKANTDDIRESPATSIIRDLIDIGYTINLYDPAALDNAKDLFFNDVNYCENIEVAVKYTSAIIILTEWDEFKNFDYTSIEQIVLKKIIIDFRNILDAQKLKNWQYYSLGR